MNTLTIIGLVAQGAALIAIIYVAIANRKTLFN
jgi:hypothetical protein